MLFVRVYLALHRANFVPVNPARRRQRYGAEPKFALALAVVNVNVRRFLALVCTAGSDEVSFRGA